jgi:hypothetical protein
MTANVSRGPSQHREICQQTVWSQDRPGTWSVVEHMYCIRHVRSRPREFIVGEQNVHHRLVCGSLLSKFNIVFFFSLVFRAHNLPILPTLGIVVVLGWSSSNRSVVESPVSHWKQLKTFPTSGRAITRSTPFEA